MTLSPTINPLNHITFPEVSNWLIADKIPAYSITGLAQPIVKIETVFHAGEAYSENPLIPTLTATMLTEGTLLHTSKEFAEALDFIGAEIVAITTHERVLVSMACLNKHLPLALSLYHQCLTKPRFDYKDFNIVKENAKKRMFIELENVNYVARREFQRLLYPNHPFGNIVEFRHFDNVEIKQLISFFERFYHVKNATMYVSGNISNEVIQSLQQFRGLNSPSERMPFIPETLPNKSEKLFIEKKDAVQSAICIGKTSIPFSHPDYIPLCITTTLLGGYFGSRLMTVLREEKGYTYGIEAFVANNKFNSSLIITTEVATEYTRDALSCIYEEIDKLCQKPVSVNELENVKSYLKGTLFRAFDGPFNSMESFKTVHFHGFDLSYYERYMEILNTIQPDEILQIAQRYFSNNFIEVVIGKMN